ncbi:Hsp20/alpha crystallin family protein [Natribaculum luteum]|uniref:Hsp20/alpha crystallin family protein n=1 Tax=Natribaculum luteum TaxID=1586232 RepID=A0ABD5NUP7_9EURY|nr:Hsp20/alpha crystallin family protein [Natribaculum luteum]
MTDDYPTDDSPEEPSDDRRGGNWLTSLLNALERLDRYSASERRERDDRRIDYDVSIRTGLDALEDRRGADERRPPGRRPTGTRPSTPSGSRSDTAGAARYNVTTQSYEDELLVTADVVGTDPDDVTVGFEDGTIVVAVDGRRLERVELPWPESTAEASVHNGVLTVRARPDTDE